MRKIKSPGLLLILVASTIYDDNSASLRNSSIRAKVWPAMFGLHEAWPKLSNFARLSATTIST